MLALLVVALFASSALRPAAASPGAGQVTGVVRDDQGAAVPNATVRFSPAVSVPDGGTFTPATPLASARTDRDGRYGLGLPAGIYDLIVTGGPAAAPYTAAIRGISVVAGGAATIDVVVIVPGTVRFQGKVVDTNGRPMQSTIHLELPPTYGRMAETTTAPDGSFTLMTPPGVWPLTVTALLPDTGAPFDKFDRVGVSVPSVDLTRDRRETLTFPPVGDIDVTVRTNDNLPARHLYLRCWDGCRPTEPADLFPGAGARFTFTSDGVPDSQGKVGLRGFSATGASVLLSATDALREVRRSGVTVTAPGPLILDQPRIGPTVTFQGVLKDGAGAPLTGHVTLTGDDGYRHIAETYEYDVVEPPGVFRLAVPPGRYRLDISAEVGTVWEQLGVESGVHVDGLFVTVDDHLDLTSDRTQDLTVPITSFPVTVVDADGRPVPWVDVDGTSGATDKPDEGDAVVELFPGGTGRGRLVNTDGWTDDTGTKQLKVFAGAAPPVITVASGLAVVEKKVARTATAAEVRLPRNHAIGGQIRDPGGALPGFVRLDARELPGRTQEATSIRDDGTWGFTAPTGRYAVRLGYAHYEYDDDFAPHLPTAHRPGLWWFDTELDVKGHTPIDVTLPAADRADVFFHDTDGSPVRNKLYSTATSTEAGVKLAPGVSARGTARSDVDPDMVGPGHLRAPLFGPSDMTLETGNSPYSPTPLAQFPLSPGTEVHVALAVPGATPAPLPSAPPDGGQGGPPGPGGPSSPPGGTGRSGYWALGADGKVYAFGDAPSLGDWSTGLGSAEAIDLEPTPSGAGYWILDNRGRVKAFGDAASLGEVDPGRLRSGELSASLSATPTGRGYWLFTNQGRAFTFGDAASYGDVGDVKLNGPILDSVATPSGRGYFMVASDGGIFAFGDARFAGSMGGVRLNAPVQSLVPDGDGDGYWLVASDGGIFAFNAPFRGSMGTTRLNKPVRGMVRYGNGYLMVGEDGGIFNFSDRPFSGSLGGQPPGRPVVAVAALP